MTKLRSVPCACYLAPAYCLTMSAEPDHAKVERFAALLATCQRPVFLYAMGLLHHAADAEEVLQETNLVLWRKFDQYRPGTDFARWACSVAHFEILKYREQKARKERLFSDEFIEMLAQEPPPPIDVLEGRRAALHQCLGKLPAEDRQLVLHRYQPQATTRSVAESQGRSVQGTRKSLHRIRTALLVCVQRSLGRESGT